jgi:hypothetical protein
MRKSFQGLGLGFGAIVCALACGADDKQAATPPNARGGNDVLHPSSLDRPSLDRSGVDPPSDVAGALPAGEQLSPACDDSPLSTACKDPADRTGVARSKTT